MAQKPFYYHHSPSLFLFASEPQALLRHSSVSRRVNEGMAAEYLSIVTSTTDTMLADVQRLAPGRRIAVSPHDCRVEKYWDIDAARTIRYKTVGDYCGHLRALLTQVVADRLRSATETGVLLSGGIDSSSLLATATQLRRSGRVTRDCSAFSLIEPGGPLDEQPFMDATLATLGCASHRYVARPDPRDAYRDATRRRADLASSPSARLMTAVRAGARQQGVRVLLSGIGGDEWLGGSTYHAADLLRSGRWIALGGYLRSAFSSGAIVDARSAMKIMTWPLLPATSRKRIKRWLGRDAVPPWISPSFAARIGLADRLQPADPDPPFPTIAQRTIFRDMTSGLIVHGIEDDERSAAESGLEIRYPFADRRVMEFGLAIPEDLRRRGGVRKFVLRETMKGSLPDDVRLRDTSPNGGSAFMETLTAFAREGLFDRPLIEREGWTGAGQVRAFFDRIEGRRAAGDPDYTDDVWPMWCVATVELWMREAATGPANDMVNEEARCEMTTALTSVR
jgi:asparagine synthase (glutamine-hydrolysing)